MVLLGAKPPGRHTEQHDVFFGIAGSIQALYPEIRAFWPDGGKIHIDAWRRVSSVEGHPVRVVPAASPSTNKTRLFFINLGGYQPGDFEEYHYKMLVPANTKTAAIAEAKKRAFFQHTGYEQPHIDDKYGIDVDDLYELEEILAPPIKSVYRIVVEAAAESLPEDELIIGYLPLPKA